jgi:D-alanyl-D-alanine carboxypeptidase (penicillin-binding protein 5/6)
MSRSRFFAALAVLFAAVAPARAQIATSAEHAILMDAASGQVLWAKDAFTPMPPASMSKLMTLELVFQRLKDGRLKLSDTFPVSELAWRTGGSKGFVRVGDRLTVDDLIQRIIVASGNDACMVVAEGLGGTVEGFVDMMNRRAKELGLTNSHFVNPNGLPDPPGQLMSAYDLAVLAWHLIRDDPQYYHYFSERSYTTSDQGKQITQQNRNTVLEKFSGADGLKTGYTDAAGYSITTSAVQDGRRLILVLGGLRYPDLDKFAEIKRDWIAEQRRGDEAARLLGLAFREFRSYQLFKPGDIVGQVPVAGGSKPTVAATAGAVSVTMQVDSRDAMKVTLRYFPGLKAPIAQGQRVGTLVISAPDFPGLDVPVVAAESVPEANIVWRMFLAVRHWFSGKH